MRRMDQLVDAYYSPKVEQLKTTARRSLIWAAGLGVLAVATFGGGVMLLFGMLLFGGSTLGVVLLLLAIPLVAGLVLAGWIFTFRFLWASSQAKAAVDEQMRRHVAASAESAS